VPLDVWDRCADAARADPSPRMIAKFSPEAKDFVKIEFAK